MMLPPDPQCHRLTFFRHYVNLFWIFFFFSQHWRRTKNTESFVTRPHQPLHLNSSQHV